MDVKRSKGDGSASTPGGGAEAQGEAGSARADRTPFPPGRSDTAGSLLASGFMSPGSPEDLSDRRTPPADRSRTVKKEFPGDHAPGEI